MAWVERLVLSLTCSKPLGESLKFSVHLFLHLSSKDSTNNDVHFATDWVNHLEECLSYSKCNANISHSYFYMNSIIDCFMET